MRVRFRLAEILEEFRDSGRGTVKRIATETRLERHQVSALLKNEVQYLSLNSLGAICDYLINIHHMNPADLPGRLFQLEPEGFWEFISEKQLLVMSFGVRQEMHDTGVLWVPAADSYLQGTLLHELYGTETPPRLRPDEGDANSSPPRKTAAEPGPRFDQYMVRSCSTQSSQPQEVRDAEFQQMKEEATRSYEKFHEIAGNKALICLGSVKSNGLCERVISRAFSREPWVTEDGALHAGQRACPFYYRYRDKDVNVPSCQGGRNLAKQIPGLDHGADVPGIYFERAPGQWDGIPSNDEREPALIFYTYRPPLGVVEVVLGGFSTEGTFLLAQHFHKIVAEIWPPTDIQPTRETAAFVVDFHLKPHSRAANTDATGDLGDVIRPLDRLEVIRLPETVLAHRVSHSDA